METWSKQMLACSISYVFKERSYYGLWQIDILFDAQFVTHIELTDTTKEMLVACLKEDGWKLVKEE